MRTGIGGNGIHRMNPGNRSCAPHPSLVARFLSLAGIVLLLAANPRTEGASVRLPNGFVREGLAGSELQEPMDLAFAPDGAPWITGRSGHVWRMDPQDRSVVLVGRIPTDTAGDRGLHGIAFHPDFSAASGGEVFLFHHATNKPAGLYRSRVSKWRVAGAGPAARLVPDSEKVLLEFDGEERGQHVGGGLLVHPVERLLYVTTGDNNEIGRLKSYCSDTNNQALNPGDLRGKVLRIGLDGSIPARNPFVGKPGARGEVYTVGHRQPWALSFDAPTGWVLEAENGGDELDDHEEVNRLEPGASHGWPRVFSDGMETLTRTNRIAGYSTPWFHYLRNTGGSCTGALLYRAPRKPGAFPERFLGGLFYADYNRKSVRFAPVDPKSGRPGDSESFAQNLPGGPVAMRLGPDGALYLVEYGGWFQSTTNDSISRIVWRP
jgi:glucose/arabinose dehydrogenase